MHRRGVAAQSYLVLNRDNQVHENVVMCLRFHRDVELANAHIHLAGNKVA